MHDTVALTIPRETANDDFVILVSWLVQDGGHVEEGTAVALFETSKATVDLISPAAGYLVHGAAELAELPVGAEIGRIEATPTRATPTRASSPAATPPTARQAEPAAVKPTPAEALDAVANSPTPPAQRWSKKAAELAKQHGLSAALFADKPLVREQDVLAAIEAHKVVVARPQPADATVAAPPRPTAAGLARVERVAPLSVVKRTEIRYLHAGNDQALVSAITVAVRADGLQKRIAAASDRRMSYLAFVVPAAARALREHPELNAYLADDGVHYYADVNVGVAINLGEGLFVPVLHNADQMDNDEVARAVSSLIMTSVRGEMREADLVGGTFTVTDLTDAAAMQVFPLLNRNQSAILAMGLDTERADPRLLLTLSFDHRVSDGLQAAQFLGAVKHELESVVGSEEPARVVPVCTGCRTNLRRLRADGIAEYLLTVVNETGEQSFLCPTCFLGFTD
jgi:pyruvate/2-oxoglutarate dehydrogenase complex dihydrolipoamide acyltransferase (E2) component